MSNVCTKHKLDLVSSIYYPWTQEDCPYCEINQLKRELEDAKEMANAFMDERNALKAELAEAITDKEAIGKEYDRINNSLGMLAHENIKLKRELEAVRKEQ